MVSFASRSSKDNKWVLSLKLVLVSSCVLSLAVVFKLSVPVISDFVVTELPSTWSSMLSWLRPLYLYILINCIIISIVASSKLQNHKPDIADVVQKTHVDVPTEPVPFVSDERLDYAAYNGILSGEYVYDTEVEAREMEVREHQAIPDWGEKVDDEKLISGGDLSGDGRVSTSVETGLQRKDSMDFQFEKENERPPVSARFAHRRAIKSSPEGGKVSLGVSKPKRQDTLETTWKTITEGRSMPLARHLKKSDTWDTHVRRPMDDRNGTPPPAPKMKKSETFSEGSAKDSSPSPSPGPGKLRRESSPSQDELNRRVEAFIKKFNEEMRLQRLASLNQYQEIVSRGGSMTNDVVQY